MATDDAGLADRLDRFLDALAEGSERSPNGRPALEPDLAATARRLRAHDDAPPADRAFADRLLEDLMRATTYPDSFPANPVADLTTTLGGQTALRPASRPVRRLDTSRPRWMLAQFATAALLLLTLGSVYVAFVSRQLPGGNAPVVAPALSQDPVEFVWQTEGGPGLRLTEPNYLAVDPEGNLWVPDGHSRSHQFQIFAPDGSFLEAWGTLGSAEGQLNLVAGGIAFGEAAFDRQGNIYVIDTGNRRVQKFGPDRAFIAAWGSEGRGDGQFLRPLGLALDAQGQVYVTDSTRGDVQVFDSDGRFLAAWGGPDSGEGHLINPGGVTVDAAGNVWVADIGTHRVHEFSPEGEFLTSWGGYGSGEGQLNTPTDVAVDGQGRVFVAERLNNRVQIFAADGRRLASWGEYGTDAGEFSGTIGIVLDGQGHVYVADDVGLRVQKFRLLAPLVGDLPAAVPTAEAETAIPAEPAAFVWQTEGGPDLPLSDPIMATFDPQGNLWVVDGRNSRFQIFSPDGTFLEVWGTPGSADGQFQFAGCGLFGGSGAGGVAFDAAGSFYVADPCNHRIQKFGSDRAYITAWGSEGHGDGQFIALLGLAVDGQDRVYVTDEERGDVQVFASDGRFLASWGGADARDGWLPHPAAITVDPDGNLWIAHFREHRVQKYSPDGALLATFGGYGTGQGQLRQPNDVAVDGQGRIYVVEWGNQRVQVFAADGQILAEWGDLGLDGGRFMGPNSIVVDGEGGVYVADDGSDRVQKFQLLPPLAEDTAMDAPTVTAATASAADPAELVWQSAGGPDHPFDDPGQMAIDPRGNLWIPDGGNGRFQVFAPDGAFLESWGSPGSGDGQFDFLLAGFGLGAAAFDAAGILYVADTGNHRVQKFGPDRAFITAWGGEGIADGQFLAPVDVAVDGQGRVYVTDWNRDDVQVFAGDGRFLAKWGGYGPEPGHLIEPTGVTVDAAGDVSVADAYNHRLQRFSPDGALLGGWGAYGADTGKLDNPVDLAMDGRGRVYVADWGNHRVQVFDSEGRFLAEWGGLGSGDGQFIGLASIVVDGSGQVYVADNDRDRVQAFRLPPLYAT